MSSRTSPPSFRFASMTMMAGMALLLSAVDALASGPSVVASIRPLHGLVAAVMEDIGEPELLVTGAQSPHHFTLKPSAARRLQGADVVFITGLGLIPGLEHTLATVAAKARIVDLSSAPGLTLLEQRKLNFGRRHADAGHDAPEHRNGREHGHDHGTAIQDPHFWLDPFNAKIMVTAIAAALAAADSARATAYNARAATVSRKLDALTEAAKRDLAPMRERPFLVYHDAFQYLEHRFELRGMGAVTPTPETAPGVAHMRETQKAIGALDRPCIFTEPGARPKLVETLIAGFNARVAVLDPLGTSIERGPEHYFRMTSTNVAAIKGCLSQR